MTRILDRYIIRTIIASTLLVVCLLLGLYLFILFIDQLYDIGKGQYNVWRALGVVSLMLLQQLYMFFPIASLLGSLIGLGMLANQRELIVMRASGMSMANITFAVLKAAGLMILVMTFLGEVYAPKCTALATDIKLKALSGGHALRTSKGVWVRNQQDFLFLGRVLSDDEIRDVLQLHYDAKGHLQFFRNIQTLRRINHHWSAYDVSETAFFPTQTKVQQWSERPWEINLNTKFLQMVRYEVDEMNVVMLYRQIQLAQSMKQTTAQLKLAFWQRLLQPLNTLIMMILAVPFIFGPLRSSSMGEKLLLGIGVGFGFHILNHFFAPMTQVFQWPAEMGAFIPTLVFGVLSLYLMRHMKG